MNLQADIFQFLILMEISAFTYFSGYFRPLGRYVGVCVDYTRKKRCFSP